MPTPEEHAHKRTQLRLGYVWFYHLTGGVTGLGGGGESESESRLAEMEEESVLFFFFF